MTTSDAIDFGRRFDDLLAVGRRAVEAERYEDALGAFEEAERLAEAASDRAAADRAFANHCGVLISKARTGGLPAARLQRLREILMAGEDPVSCFLAAYNLARAFEFTKENRKGAFYARIALDRSRKASSREWLASSSNQLGNLLLADSRFEAACEQYEDALALVPANGESTTRQAAIHLNLGYAYVVLGRLREGFGLLFHSLRTLRAMGNRSLQVIAHLRLSFAHLEVERPRYALKHALRALALAEEVGEQDSTKHALFLLGESAQLAGDRETAREQFQRLQERYFPDKPGLAELLLTLDVRRMINFKA